MEEYRGGTMAEKAQSKAQRAECLCLKPLELGNGEWKVRTLFTAIQRIE